MFWEEKCVWRVCGRRKLCFSEARERERESDFGTHEVGEIGKSTYNNLSNTLIIRLKCETIEEL